MSKDIRIKKGLDIKLVGDAEQQTSEVSLGSLYAVRLGDFHGVIPKILAKIGTEVKAGQALFYSKSDERILFPSPVSGKVVDIVRGARRKVLEIKIEANSTQVFEDFGKKEVSSMSAEEIKTHLFTSGCWPFVKQRPYDVVANPNQAPKAIFVSAYNSAPLAADYDYTLQGKEEELQTALTALTKLTEGKVHVSVGSSKSPLAKAKGVEIHTVSGPHPVGNVSTQIAQVNPINKGEVVWVVTPDDLVVIGELFLTGKFSPKRTIALTGSKFKTPKYVTAIAGATISDLIGDNLDADNARVISGNVLSGLQVEENGFLGFYDTQVTAIPEGNDYEFFGWNKPIFNKVSTSRALTFSWLTPNKKYDLNTNTNGEHRAFVVTGSYEEVFPLEFICVSKQPHQKIIREGLDLMREELG